MTTAYIFVCRKHETICFSTTFFLVSDNVHCNQARNQERRKPDNCRLPPTFTPKIVKKCLVIRHKLHWLRPCLLPRAGANLMRSAGVDAEWL